MVLILFGSDQVFKDEAVKLLAYNPEYNQDGIEVVHKPTKFLEAIYEGSKPLFWAKVDSLVRQAEKESQSTIFDFSLLDYLKEVEDAGKSSPSFRESILKKIKPTYRVFLVDDTGKRREMTQALLSWKVPFQDITDAISCGEMIQKSGVK